jgi:hypothetical protein
MVRTIRLTLSAWTIVAAIALGAHAFSTPHALAGNQVSCLPIEEGVIQNQGDVNMAQQPTNTPTPTCTPEVKVRTATPTAVKTAPATNTSVPATEAPATNTPVPPPPTATKTGGGVGGQGVQPPNTGSGPDSGTVNWIVLGAGAFLLLVGGTSLAGAARRRR